MKWVSVSMVAVSTLFLGGSLLAADKSSDKTDKTSKTDKASKDKTAKWALIKLGDELKVVREDKLADIKKDLDKENKETKAKNKKAVLKTLTTIKGGFATEKDALKYKDDYIEQQKKKASAKTDKATKTK